MFVKNELLKRPRYKRGRGGGNPFFENRYAQIHCLPIPKFHYMFHFTINENNQTVHVHALINTNKDPNTSWIK